jgi:hypothetical protein
VLFINSFSFAGNAELYSKVGVPFVIGTTGGDRDLLYKTVEDSKNYAVISPQMGKQVNHNSENLEKFFYLSCFTSFGTPVFCHPYTAILFPLGCCFSCSYGNYGRAISWSLFWVFLTGISFAVFTSCCFGRVLLGT